MTSERQRVSGEAGLMTPRPYRALPTEVAS